MEAFNALIFKKSNFSSGISPFRPNFSIPNQLKGNPSRKYGTHLSFSFSSSSHFSNGQNLRISAHFGRASKRRNSLRKKLIEEQKCIELYTNEGGADKVGFYSLEMAEDLELDPKQYHVIAFEDPGDSKSFCYIIQAHMEILGRGSAFVVARPPKDAFREAKANGFGVTVMRKGELQLNVDQTLEEVEEQISEIGSKVYHDKIIQERSVDMGSLMKGVFGSSKPSKRRRSKRTLKKLPGTEH